MMAEGRRGELDLVDLLHDFFSVLLAYSATHVFSVGGGARLERAKRGWFAEQQRLAVEFEPEYQAGENDSQQAKEQSDPDLHRSESVTLSASETPAVLARRALFPPGSWRESLQWKDRG